MNAKSGTQSLLFCANKECRVISYVPLTTGGGAHVPLCPSCHSPGVRVRGPVDETNFRARLEAIREVPPSDEVQAESEARSDSTVVRDDESGSDG